VTFFLSAYLESPDDYSSFPGPFGVDVEREVFVGDSQPFPHARSGVVREYFGDIIELVAVFFVLVVDTFLPGIRHYTYFRGVGVDSDEEEFYLGPGEYIPFFTGTFDSHLPISNLHLSVR